MNKLNQRGFGAFGVFLVIALLAVVVLAGLRVYDMQNDENAGTATTQEAGTEPAVNDASDLDAAADYLNDQDIDKELDTAELDAVLN